MFHQPNNSPLIGSQTAPSNKPRRVWGTKLVAASALTVGVLFGAPAFASAAPALVEEGSYDEISTTTTDMVLALVEEGSYDK